MIRAILISILVINLSADTVKKCDKCSIAKEYMKCTYYVEQKADKSHKKSCQIYAQEMDRNNNKGRAAWYYLISGDLNSAIKAGNSALKVGENYAAEYIAEAYLIQNDQKKASNFFKKITKSSKDSELMMSRHFSILSRLYPKKFDIKLAQKLYDNR